MSLQVNETSSGKLLELCAKKMDGADDWLKLGKGLPFNWAQYTVCLFYLAELVKLYDGMLWQFCAVDLVMIFNRIYISVPILQSAL